MIIPESKIRDICMTDPPCRRRACEEVAPKMMTKCVTCCNQVSLEMGTRVTCPICQSVYDTSIPPIVKFINIKVVIETPAETPAETPVIPETKVEEI